jgi:Protein of unknown function (DUF2510)
VKSVNRWAKRRSSAEPKLVQAGVPAGWYPDPSGPGTGQLRWWDGVRWTMHVCQPQSAQNPGCVANLSAHDGLPRVFRLPEDGRRRVVGEHFYQAALERICRGESVPRAGQPGCWDNSLPVTVRLVAEHDNPHDQTAVRADVAGATVGHLPREDAAQLHHYVAAVQEAGQHAECEGRIVVASNGEYAIYLHLGDLDAIDSALRLSGIQTGQRTQAQTESAEDRHREDAVSNANSCLLSAAELDDARMAYQANYNHRTMNCGRGSAEITTVIGTSQFQDELRRAAVAPRPWRHQLDPHLPAVLAPDPDKPTMVAVLIDGHIVGFLAPEVVERHHEQLQEIRQAGQRLVCSALIVGGSGRTLGIRLQIKPDVGRRWTAGAKLST